MENPDSIFELHPGRFEERAIQIFNQQFERIPVYREFTLQIGRNPQNIRKLEDIPYLPVQFFKTHKVIAPGKLPTKLIFESSGTTGAEVSRHYIENPEIYQESFNRSFQLFYGEVKKYCILGLLPSYLERGASSLVYMVDELIRKSQNQLSGFYLNEYEQLYETLKTNEKNRQPALLIGVTYALLDFFERFPIPLQYTHIIETGGMKGRRKELTRKEVHSLLKNCTGLACIHAEYGMTELLSQAWSECNGIFNCPPWMKVGIRAEDDPFDVHFSETLSEAKTGVVNVIDLANINSCSFIAIDDLAKLYPDGSFEISGRLDHSDIRGCSLLYTGGLS